MFLIQSRVRNVFATNEKSGDLEELGPKQSSNSPTPSLGSDPPDGGFQAWATVFGWYAISSSSRYPRIHNGIQFPDAVLCIWAGVSSFLLLHIG